MLAGRDGDYAGGVVGISRLRSEDTESAAKILWQFTQRQTPADCLKAFLASDSHFFLAASIADAWVGFAYAYELPRPDDRSMLFLYSIDVASEYRRHGVGTALLSYLRRIAGQHGKKKLFAIADRSNDAAVSFYRATGGIVEGGDSLCIVYPFHDPANVAQPLCKLSSVDAGGLGAQHRG